MSDLPFGLSLASSTSYLYAVLREVEACEIEENGKRYSEDRSVLEFRTVPNVEHPDARYCPFKVKHSLAVTIYHQGLYPNRFIGEGARSEVIREATRFLDRDKLFDLIAEVSENTVVVLLRNRRQHGTNHVWFGPLGHVHISWLPHFQEWARNYYESL